MLIFPIEIVQIFLSKMMIFLYWKALQAPPFLKALVKSVTELINKNMKMLLNPEKMLIVLIVMNLILLILLPLINMNLTLLILLPVKFRKILLKLQENAEADIYGKQKIFPTTNQKKPKNERS